MSEDWKKIKVNLKNGDAEAYINVPFMTPEGALETPLTIEDARKALENAKVSVGILQDQLKEIFDKPIFDQEILIAKGEPARDSEDGRIEYFFEVGKKFQPKEDTEGRIDYKNVSLLTNVSKGNELCRLHHVKEGKPGKTVTGKEIPPKKGLAARIPQGPNTEISPSDPDLLVASTDGCVALNSGGVVEVQPTLEIKGDVDYSTGNINFVGSLKVSGDIKSGFTVKTSGDLEVEGCVEDAEIEVGGNLLIKKGFIGRGKGSISSRGDVTIKYVQGQNIFCDGNLSIGGELIQSKVRVGGDVFVDSKKGAIIGGTLEAEGSIEATQIGNFNYTPTEVAVGCNFKLRERLNEIDKELKQVAVNKEKVKRGLNNLSRLRMKSNGKLPPEQESLYERLQETSQYYPKYQKELEEEGSRIEKEIVQQRAVYVKVKKSLFPRVKITIGKFPRVFNEQFENKVFREIKGAIVDTV